MKISKLKALTIATSVIGTASLGSVVGLVSVAAVDTNSSENQNYSETGNGGSNSSTGTGGNDNSSGGSIDTSTNKPANVVTEADVKKAFTDQKTTKPNEKVFTALDDIKTDNDLYYFYPKPSNFLQKVSNVTLDSVQITRSTPDKSLGLQVKITVNGQVSTTFVIYGFSPYTDQDYKRIFESANPSGKFTVNGKYFPYLDFNDLSTNPTDQYYLGNFFQPVIPKELSANNIVATPVSFNLLPGNVVNYHYKLHTTFERSQSSSSVQFVSIDASVPVSAYYVYQYPIETNAYNTPVTKNWKPVNFDFIKANLPANFTRSQFDKFIWKHWNGSTVTDAINAFRYWYLFDQTNLTSKLNTYVSQSHDYTSVAGKYSIGSLILGSAKTVNISPTYDASANFNNDDNKYELKLNWRLRNVSSDLISQLVNILGWNGPFKVDGNLKIAFDYNKPASLNKNGLLEVPVTLTTDVYFSNQTNQKVYLQSQVVKTGTWTIFDALYSYFKNGNALNKSFPTPFFSQFLENLKNLVKPQ